MTLTIYRLSSPPHSNISRRLHAAVWLLVQASDGTVAQDLLIPVCFAGRLEGRSPFEVKISRGHLKSCWWKSSFEVEISKRSQDF